MMFQAEKPVRIFGECKKGVDIHVRFLDQEVKIRTKSHQFLIELEPVSFRDKGFSFTVYTKKQEVTIYNCLVGDVYLFTGGMNAYMPLKESFHEADYPQATIRFLDLNRTSEQTSCLTEDLQWVSAEAKDLENFSALSYLFAKQLHQVIRIPIGVISCSRKETSIFSWVGNKEINSHIELYDYVNRLEEEAPSNEDPSSSLFDRMIQIIAPFSLRSIVQYQGENDHKHLKLYGVALQRVIHSYRIYFKDPYLPFIITQIAGGHFPDSEADAVSHLRLIQSNLISEERRVYLASTVDLGEEDTHYLKDKLTIAKRLANLALEKNYRMLKNTISPAYYSHNLQENQLVIFTQHNYLNLVSRSKKNRGFTYSTDGIHFKDADNVKLVNNQIIIKNIAGAKEIRYAYEDFPVCDIYTTNALPLLPFRLIL